MAINDKGTSLIYPSPDKCQRCGTPTYVSMMSWFNTEQICMTCVMKERQHPAYKKARQVCDVAYRMGQRNFPGIGLPKDLKP
jgi:recombinational DNA repair protein (RecF pathway)